MNVSQANFDEDDFLSRTVTIKPNNTIMKERIRVNRVANETVFQELHPGAGNQLHDEHVIAVREEPDFHSAHPQRLCSGISFGAVTSCFSCPLTFRRWWTDDSIDTIRVKSIRRLLVPPQVCHASSSHHKHPGGLPGTGTSAATTNQTDCDTRGYKRRQYEEFRDEMKNRLGQDLVDERVLDKYIKAPWSSGRRLLPFFPLKRSCRHTWVTRTRTCFVETSAATSCCHVVRHQPGEDVRTEISL